MKTALVCGAGGFIGGHLVKRLKREGFWVRGVDLKFHEYRRDRGRRFRRRRSARRRLLPSGGRSAVRRGLSARRRHGRRRLHLHRRARRRRHAQFGDDQPQHARTPATSGRSSGSSIRRRPACTRPTTRTTRTIPTAPKTPPIRPRRTANTAGRSCSASGCISPMPQLRDARRGSRASTTSSARRAPGTAARRRRRRRSAARWPKRQDGGEIEIWGDGQQTRSFLYVDECLEGTLRLMRSDFAGPVNIGSEEMVTINQLVDMVVRHRRQESSNNATSRARSGVRGRNSDNRLIRASARLGAQRSRCAPGSSRPTPGSSARSMPIDRSASDEGQTAPTAAQRRRRADGQPARAVSQFEL